MVGKALQSQDLKEGREPWGGHRGCGGEGFEQKNSTRKGPEVEHAWCLRWPLKPMWLEPTRRGAQRETLTETLFVKGLGQDPVNSRPSTK